MPATSPVPLRVLIAPDSFKGTFDARTVASAIAEGARSAGAVPIELPVADGGEGTMDVLVAARGGRWTEHVVSDPRGRPVEARIGWIDDGRTAIIEVAEASGLTLVPEAERDAEAATSFGTGELIAHAARDGATHILVGAGGSATSDGGSGALRAIADAGGIGGAELTVLCDVDVPFEHAGTVFAPQKGADAHAVRRITERLESQAAQLPSDPRGRAMTGAAGGLAGGLWSALGATLAPGASIVLDVAGFDAHLGRADLVVCGEGRLDDQSGRGKIVGVLARRAHRVGIPVVAVAGSATVTPAEVKAIGLAGVHVASTLGELREAGCDVVEEWLERATTP